MPTIRIPRASLAFLVAGSLSAGIVAQASRPQPERRVYFAGDHLNMNAWMQGAFESGRQVATALHARVGSVRRLSASARP